MNLYVAGIKKDLVPRYVTNGYNIYIGFVHESAKRPLRYYDFADCNGYGVIVEDVVPYEGGDYIYPLGISSYFELNDELMSRGTKYNLMKKRHEYNRRKYGKIRSNNNTV
jgi:hypothetical protein